MNEFEWKERFKERIIEFSIQIVCFFVNCLAILLCEGGVWFVVHVYSVSQIYDNFTLKTPVKFV